MCLFPLESYTLTTPLRTLIDTLDSVEGYEPYHSCISFSVYVAVPLLAPVTSLGATDLEMPLPL